MRANGTPVFCFETVALYKSSRKSVSIRLEPLSASIRDSGAKISLKCMRAGSPLVAHFRIAFCGCSQ